MVEPIAGMGEHRRSDLPNHALAVPVSDEQLWEMSSRFIADGLSSGERVAYFDDGTADSVLERLDDDGVDIASRLRSGQLQIVPSPVTRDTLTAPLGEVGRRLEGAIASAVDDGWNGLRFTGTLAHGLQRRGGGGLPDVDRVVDLVVRDRPASVLCFYDHDRYPPELIDRMRELHSSEIEAPALYDDALLRITEGQGGSVRLAGEIDHSNRQQVRRVLEPLLADTVRSACGPAEIVLDLTSLRFCDIASAVSVVLAAGDFPSSHRLVLTGVRPLPARVLERAGAGLAPQLDVRTRVRPEPIALDA